MWKELVKGTVDRLVWSDSTDWSPNSRSIYYKDPTKGAVMRVGRGGNRSTFWNGEAWIRMRRFAHFNKRRGMDRC